MATVTTQERTNILKLVAGMFNAAPGATYLNEFTDAFVALNKDLGALANALGQTGAFKSLYPSFLSAEEFANKFLDTLGLKANTEAQDWVKAKVTAGESYASVAFQALVAIDASTAAEFKAAKDQLTNKAAVAEYYSVEQNKSATDLAALQAVVAKVTNDAATVEAAKAGAAATAGKEFSLTAAIGESIVGTAGNDTFKAIANVTNATSNVTLQVGDSIDGGAGTDTLTIVAEGTAAAIPGSASIKNVEIINFDATGGTFAANTVKASSFTGVKELNQIDTGTAGNFQNVVAADGVAVGFTGNGQVGAAAADVGAGATIDFGASATAGVVNLSGVGDGSAVTLLGQTTTANTKLATLTVNGSVAANSATTAGALTIDLGSAAAANKVDTLKLNLTSKAIVTVSDAFALKTLDASGSTGGLTITATAGSTGLTKVETIKTGSAGDTLTLTLSTDSLLTKVDLGAGADTLTLSDVVTAAATTPLNNKALEINLGAGADTLTLATGAAALNNVQDTADLTKGLITVADFKIGEDTINLAGVGKALTKTVLDNAAAASTLQAAIAVVATDLNASGSGKTSAVFKYGTDSYVFIDAGTNGLTAGDGLIKLVGVDATLLSTDQNGGLVV